MAKYNYSVKGISPEHTATAVGRTLPISTKQSIEICSFIRNKSLQKAKALLNEVAAKKTAVPFKRFKAVGHRKGKLAAGRYPIKASKEILKLLESVEANAQFKGLSTANLVINHICAHKASRPWHYGRQRRRKMKRTNIEIIVKEQAIKKEEVKAKPKKEEKAKKKGPGPKKEEKVKQEGETKK